MKTIQALNYLMILNSHTQDSIPIVTDTAVAAPPAPFQTRAAAFGHVVSLLDGAVTDLQAGGTSFPFALPSGFTGFNTPANFILFNRGLRARVAVYTGDFAGALTALAASFVDVPGPLALGVYMDYGTGAGDTPNPLSIDPQQGENFAHPSLETGAQLQVDGVTLDQRFVDKIVPRPISSNNGLTSDLGWIRYPSPGSPIPIIKKESHCPIVIDPSQGAGRSDLVMAMCKGAAAMGADALLIEVHPNPAEAWSDGAQQVTLEGFAKLMDELKPFIAAAGRE